LQNSSSAACGTWGITADSTDAQTLKTELATKQVELEKALKPRAVVRKMTVVGAEAVVKGDSK
jgi:hypothetical protein